MAFQQKSDALHQIVVYTARRRCIASDFSWQSSFFSIAFHFFKRK